MHHVVRASFGLFLAITGVANASIIHYNDADRAAWFEDAGIVTTIGFTDYPENTIIAGQYMEEFGVLFENGPWVVEDTEDYPNDGFGLFGPGFDGILLSFDSERQWIGVDHIGSMQFVLYRDGVQVGQSQEFIHSGQGHFAGIYSSEPFDQVWLTDFDGSVAIDDLHFGAPVPAPGVIAVLAFALSPNRRQRTAH